MIYILLIFLQILSNINENVNLEDYEWYLCAINSQSTQQLFKPQSEIGKTLINVAVELYIPTNNEITQRHPSSPHYAQKILDDVF